MGKGKGKKLVSGLALLLIIAFPLFSWEDHSALSWFAFTDLGLDEKVVLVRTLEDFVHDNQKELSVFFDSLEEFLQEHIPNYPPLPEVLRFGDNHALEPQTQLFYALRLNPEYSLTYFYKVPPGGSALENPISEAQSEQEIPFEQLAYVPYNYPYARFFPLYPGQEVKAQIVLSTASDEPDYGFDINLFEDNLSLHGGIYGFGDQPFGNPEVSYGSQAPFHMGFYHESSLVYLAAPAMARAFPDLRVLQMALLSKLAFSLGEEYWGYRFAGWGLHYLQDLLMPYHASIMPGSSGLYLVWVGVLDLLGIKKPYEKVLTDVTNKHFLFEMVQLERINTLAVQEKFDDPILTNLGFSGKSEDPQFDPVMLRGEISKLGRDAGAQANRALEALIRNHQKYAQIQEVYEQVGYDIYDIASSPEQKEFAAFGKLLASLLKEVGRYSRSYLTYCLQ